MKTTCERCGSPIEWVAMLSGKKMPIDAKRRVVVTLKGETVSGYESHFATCGTARKDALPAVAETRRLTHEHAALARELEEVKAIARELAKHVAADARELACACQPDRGACWSCVSAKLSERAAQVLDARKAVSA